ncbi:MAG TPA: VWA domain-containing protein, partial [Anaeromyxobacteraceae bacterium]|nr:VWA domain-containing protein [Anaeromyxobacteraceae bacterium]
FAYLLQDQFAQVRSFVFVSDLGETTELFRQHEIARAIELAYGGAVVNVFANSNFGRAFVTFLERFGDAVTGKTTVIVIGDGRNNYHPAEAWALGQIGARAKRVLWLNPEPPLSWAFGDSAMREYEPHCDRVEVVKNVEELSRIVEALVRSCYGGGSGASPGAGAALVAPAATVTRLPWRHGGVTVKP